MSERSERIGPCIDCIYFTKGPRWEWDHSGVCHRYPQPVKRTEASRKGCGEFVCKEEA